MVGYCQTPLTGLSSKLLLKKQFENIKQMFKFRKGSNMKTTEEELELRFRLRAMETVSVEIPKDALASLKKVAAIRDMSYQALLKFYIG
jgi:hypothetical protein